MKRIALSILIATGAIVFTGSCREKTTKEKVEDGIEEVGESIEEAGEEIEDATDQ